MSITASTTVLECAWLALGGSPELASTVQLTDGPPLPATYHVTALATGVIGSATLAAAELLAQRTGRPVDAVHVDAAHANVAFGCERHLRSIGWTLPPVWDPIAGDYRARDTWIRLHTNYAWHRAAALKVLGCEGDKAAVAAAVREWDASALEDAVVAANGCAASLRTPGEWAAHPVGAAVAREPLVHVSLSPGESRRLPKAPTAPLSEVRVLDLTRVIAGPIATRLLAGWGADVLRIDPPGFEEVAALLPETTAGKRCAALALETLEGRTRFLALVRDADVLVLGLRPAALDALGLSVDVLKATNPALIIVRHNAYGWSDAATTGAPWRERRGFDSLLQLSTGLAAHAMSRTGAERPVPLPVQALDHATGYLEAAAAIRGLTERERHGNTTEYRLSLARTAHLLESLGGDGDVTAKPPEVNPAHLERVTTAWGPIDRARLPGRIGDRVPVLVGEAGPLGSHDASWVPRP
ncbi:MAG: CoA transferase [Myxococcales bacterium]|nr:CoA transferase [Myxococcales bacterium]